MDVTIVDVNCTDNVCEMTAGVEMTSLCRRRTMLNEIADVGSADDSPTGGGLHRFVCRQLTDVVDKGMAFSAVEPAHRVHVVLVVVARQCRRQGRICSADGTGECAEIEPLVKTMHHSSRGRLYVAVLGAVGLIPLSEVYTE